MKQSEPVAITGSRLIKTVSVYPLVDVKQDGRLNREVILNG